jgi:diaminohydroxyphosphoribosylaminopyrimidine deaminase/5-amino-6-(5-phosphoribosylamino)uracil reductase
MAVPGRRRRDDRARSARSQRGAEVLLLPGPDGQVDLPALLNELARRGINEVHAEAGFGLSGACCARGWSMNCCSIWRPV